MSTLSPDSQNTPFGAPPRPLTEEVLQSSEEAVLANPASVETLQSGQPVPDAPAMRTETPRERLARHVADKPVQSALVALAAGALVAAIIKSALSGRRH